MVLSELEGIYKSYENNYVLKKNEKKPVLSKSQGDGYYRLAITGFL